MKETYKTGRLKPEEERVLKEFKKTKSLNKETVNTEDVKTEAASA